MPEPVKRYLFNVEEWRGSLPIQRMTFAERGVFQEMLNQQWLSDDRSLPDDPEAVAELIAPTPAHAAEVLAAWPVVRRKFVADRRDPTRIYNIKLEQIRRQQRERFKVRQEAGRRGGKASGRKRWSDKDLDSKQTLSNASANVGIAEVMPTVRIGEEGKGREGFGKEEIGARSKRPIYQSDRFVVFEWQLDELGRSLGPHLDAFDLHAFFDDLSQRSRAHGLVIPSERSARWAWLQAQVEAEARRRGLPMASLPAVGKSTTRLATALANIRAREAV